MIPEARTTRPSARRQAPPHLAGGNTSTERNWGNDNAMSNAGSGRRLFRAIFWSVLIVTTFPLASEAQYKGDDIPGFLGLQSGTQAPPGIYVGNVVWVYPTSTIKDNSGHAINLPGSLTSTAEIILLNVVTNYKLFGANVGGSAGFPFIKNRIELNSLDVNTPFAYTDMFLGASLGWSLKRADIMAGYNLYIPTGRFSSGGTDNTGLGMWGNEFTIGSTVYPDQKKLWNVAATFALEFHTDKSGTNINVGDMGTVQGGVGRTFYKKVSGPVPMIMNLGVAGYVQFKVTGDSGSDIPPALRGYKDRVFGLGPEFNIYIPKPRLSLLVRYEPEFGARLRTQGQTVVFSIGWVAKSLVKQPH
jgi:hypothetical protein